MHDTAQQAKLSIMSKGQEHDFASCPFGVMLIAPLDVLPVAASVHQDEQQSTLAWHSTGSNREITYSL